MKCRTWRLLGVAVAAAAAVSCSDYEATGPVEFGPPGPLLGEALSSALECEVISFDGFTHRDVIGPFSLFGGDVTVTPSALNKFDEDVGPRAYDTELWDLDGATARPAPPNSACVPQNFHYDQQRYINCPECLGKMAVATNRCYEGTDATFDSDNLGGASITFSFTGGPFTIPSFEAVDCDDASKNILLKVGNSGEALTLIGSCDPADGGEGYGDGFVSDVTTTPVEFNDIATFEFLGSGGIDNIEVCRVCTAAIGDFVWQDDNGNGIQDAGEPGIPGVTVNLLMGSDVVATTTTDANGFYLFSGLCPGMYEVEFVPPPNFEFTTPNVGGDDTVDSDADPVTGRTGPIELAAGETDVTWDAGFAPCAPCKGGVTSITLKLLTSGTPFFDIDNDETVDDLGDNTYRISGPVKDDGTLDKLGDFEVFVDGVEDMEIHTSCSQPVDPGLIYGSFLIVASSSKDNGPICPLGECSSDLLEQKLDGNKFEWKIENTGVSSLVVKSIDVSWPSAFGNLKKIELNGTIYEGPTAGPSLNLMEGDFLGIPKNRWIKPGDDDVLKFEWQEDISSSAEFSITVMFYGSDNETCVLEFTGDEEPGDGGLSCADGKPQVLVMQYTGTNCTDNPPNDNPFAGPPCNDQDEGKITVTGNPTGVVPNIWYKAGKKSDPSDGDADRWGMGQVADGTLSIDATNGGDSKLAADTWVHLYSDANYTTVFQSIRFHTSCSQPLALEDEFGSLRLVEYFPEP